LILVVDFMGECLKRFDYNTHYPSHQLKNVLNQLDR